MLDTEEFTNDETAVELSVTLPSFVLNVSELTLLLPFIALLSSEILSLEILTESVFSKLASNTIEFPSALLTKSSAKFLPIVVTSAVVSLPSPGAVTIGVSYH